MNAFLVIHTKYATAPSTGSNLINAPSYAADARIFCGGGNCAKALSVHSIRLTSKPIILIFATNIEIQFNSRVILANSVKCSARGQAFRPISPLADMKLIALPPKR